MRSVILAFDDYVHVPEAKCMMQIKLQWHLSKLDILEREPLPSTVPSGEFWEQCIANRTFKAKVRPGRADATQAARPHPRPLPHPRLCGAAHQVHTPGRVASRLDGPDAELQPRLRPTIEVRRFLFLTSNEKKASSSQKLLHIIENTISYVAVLK
jgi:hypothetical protein